jgi:hypothetical protein
MTGKLLSDVSNADDMNADEVLAATLAYPRIESWLVIHLGDSGSAL